MQYDDETDILTVGPDPDGLTPRPMRSAIAPLLELATRLRPRERNAGALKKAAARLGDMMGEDGLYSWKQGGTWVEGLTASAARALANEYGQVAFGIQLDDVTGDRVECTAYAVDLARVVIVQRPAVFHMAPAPGKYAGKHDQRERWKTMQMQAGFSKALRGAILQLVPPWMQRECIEAIKGGSLDRYLEGYGGDLRKAIGATVQAFGGIGVELAQLEQHVGAARDLWTARDYVALRQVYGAIDRGDTTVAAEFPAPAAIEAHTLADIADEGEQ